ncbi:hypothetical protein QTP86_010847, partial [Hemibagrus guttatus]
MREAGALCKKLEVPGMWKSIVECNPNKFINIYLTSCVQPTPNAAAPESQEVIMLLRQNSYCFRKIQFLSVSPVYSVDSSVQQRAASLLNPAVYCNSGPVLSDWRSL